jgi:hypothetical protein
MLVRTAPLQIQVWWLLLLLLLLLSICRLLASETHAHLTARSLTHLRLRALVKSPAGVMDEPVSAWDWSKLKTNATTEASVASARRLSATATVLLKNEAPPGSSTKLLPLVATAAVDTASGEQNGKSASIAVIGFGTDGAVVHGGGSGSVAPSYIVTPLDGIRAAAGKGTTVTFDDGTNLDTAAKAAAAADVAVVFVATMSHEGADRVSLSLDDGCIVGASNAGTSARTLLVLLPHAICCCQKHCCYSYEL